MNKSTRKLLLLGLTSVLLFTGCKKTKVVDVGGKQYLQNGNHYTEISDEAKTFEPGTHIIYYNVDIPSFSDYSVDGWGEAYLGIPEVPEGYKYVDTIVIDLGGYGSTSNFVHVFVNEVPVEAIPSYNSENNEFGYFEPGTPVKRLTLNQE